MSVREPKYPRITVGTAHFLAGVRSPAEGFQVRDAHEISFIIEGALAESRVIYLLYDAAL